MTHKTLPKLSTPVPHWALCMLLFCPYSLLVSHSPALWISSWLKTFIPVFHLPRNISFLHLLPHFFQIFAQTSPSKWSLPWPLRWSLCGHMKVWLSCRCRLQRCDCQSLPPLLNFSFPIIFQGTIQRKPDRTERLTSWVEGKKMWDLTAGQKGMKWLRQA